MTDAATRAQVAASTPDEDDDWTDLVSTGPTLNQLKDRAHQSFDPLWKHGLVSRKLAYEMLAIALGVPEPEAHMRVMTRENLRRVPLISRALYLRLRRGRDRLGIRNPRRQAVE